MDADRIATEDAGEDRPLLKIRGRPPQGGKETVVLLEDAAWPVLMHFRKELGGHVPHYKADCPHCPYCTEPPKRHWYLGGSDLCCRDRFLVDFTLPCYRSAEAAGGSLAMHDGPLDMFGKPYAVGVHLLGLVVTISRRNFQLSPRVLRCEQRVRVAEGAWPYKTLYELARTMKVI